MESEFVSKDEYNKVCAALEEARAREDKLCVDKLEMEAFWQTTSEQHIAARRENEKLRGANAKLREKNATLRVKNDAQMLHIRALERANQWFMEHLWPAW
jgi:hypothetical protein